MTLADAPAVFPHLPVDAAEREAQLLAVEADLAELRCVRDSAVLYADLLTAGDSVIVAFVPVSADHEVSGQRAARTVCERHLDGVPVHVIAVDDIPRTFEGAVRSQQLLTGLIPQLARDLLAESALDS